MKILMVRNDKLGDFMLALPCFALLKQTLPDTHIAVLVPGYTAEMAAACPWIDEIIIDPGEARGGGARALSRLLRPHGFDAMIAIFSTTRTALAAKLARIPYRLAPATKLAQFLYSHRLVQRRSRSNQPEFMYNLDLAVRLLNDHGVEAIQFPRPPFLRFPEETTTALRKDFCATHELNPAHKLIFVHPGHGGSANNLSPQHYATLSLALHSKGGHSLVITAGPGEEDTARTIAGKLSDRSHTVFISRAGLRRFAEHIQCADLFISGSTGPLHIAGALDVPTAAFYPRRRSATALRWQTLNSPERRLAFSPPEDAGESDMTKIDIDIAARKISTQFLDGG